MRAFAVLLAAALSLSASVAVANDSKGRPHGFHGHCSVTALSLNFGPYNPFRAGHTDSTGKIAVSCAGKPGDTVAYTIELSAGSSGTFAQRRMRAYGTHTLNYNIYVGASRSLVWGDGNSGTSIFTDTFVQTPGKSTRNYPVYGRIFSGQNPFVGTYVDSIVVTLNF